MDFLTHLLVGRLLAVGAGHGALGALATLFAVLPDADTITWAFPRLRKWLVHRGVTHTIPFGAAAALVAAGVFAAAGWAPFGVAFAVAMLAFLTHVGLDVLNWGAPVLWPWRHGRVEWTVHGGFAWSAALSAAATGALALAAWRAPALEAQLAVAFAGALVAYLAARALLRALARRDAPKGRLVPTGNPLVWLAVGTVGRAVVRPLGRRR